MRLVLLTLLFAASTAQAVEAASAATHTATPLHILMQQRFGPHSHGPYDPPGGNPGGGNDGTFDPSKAKVFNISAFQFDYSITPSPFVVNQGDSVRINLTASDDGQGSGHGFFLETYSPTDNIITPASPVRVIEFVAHTAGTFTFFCTNVCGIGHATMDGIFTVNAGNLPTAPAVTSITPSSGSTAGGTNVTVKGERFAAGATMKIGTVSAQNVAVVDATTITATTPLGPFDIGANSARDVVITNANGESATLANGFTWTIPSPAIATISPDSAVISGGSRVTIRGAGFTSGLPISVRFGGVAATNVTVVDAVTLQATVPAHAAGAVDVVVTVGTASATASAAFEYLEPGPKRRAVRRK
jgi:IPT/TIG domain